MKLTCKFLPALIICLLVCNQCLFGQTAVISEEIKSLKTYPFSDPDPVPILTENTKIYPYFKFEGYAHERQNMPHKVVTLENDYIKVFVLPEEGGKVWGAIEKSTGEEFVYCNEVVKFRNISMRGAWTSGGIEFNFGIIGHSPSTATPVDYIMEENDDGSVSCTVGNLDLSSRTQWRVKIILPPDKAYFETQTLWYNPTPLNQSYYNWMTAAAVATEDLVFYTPGNQYLKHSGEVKPYPIDAKGRNLSAYKENNFGPAKSYHVVGEYNDFFGGYYDNSQFGFGHWGLYEEIPGQKLWIWSLSRSGGIWEDLLTDTDGQYIEWQAGRLFDQFSPGDHVNPQTKATFLPYSSDTWRELWFPVKEIGGLSDVSPDAVMHITREGNEITIGINALAHSTGNLLVKQAGQIVKTESLSLSPMEVYSKNVVLEEGHFEVLVAEMGLDYNSDPEARRLKRPFNIYKTTKISEAEELYVSGFESLKFREYDEALEAFHKCLEIDHSNQRAMVGLAELYFRRGQYKEAMAYANAALGLDTYNPHANYIAGAIYRALDDDVNALESLGWAARDMGYRSGAYAQMAEISLGNKDHTLAELYANKSLDFNRYNLNAYQVLALTARMRKNELESEEALAHILNIDPLNHFAHFERYLADQTQENKEQLTSRINSEFPFQTYLELGLSYLDKGMTKEAQLLWENAPQHPIVDLWIAYLNKDNFDLVNSRLNAVLEAPPDFVFPYRRETINALEWANTVKDHWKLKYYLALNYWGKGRTKEASEMMAECGNQPDHAPFYIARADLLKKAGSMDFSKDLTRAHDLDVSEWRTWDELINYNNSNKNYEEVLKLSGPAYQKFPENYNLGFKHAEALMNNDQYEQCIQVMDKIRILPFEHAYGARVVYEQSHLLLALEYLNGGKYTKALGVLKKSLEWPENIGVGKPYNVDSRQQHYLIAFCNGKLGNKSERESNLAKVLAYSKQNPEGQSPNDLISLLAMREAKEKDAEKLLITQLKSNDSDLSRWVLTMYYQNSESDKKGAEAQKYESLQKEILTRMADLSN